MTALPTVVFDTKPYDRDVLQRTGGQGAIDWQFMECRLSAETATAANGARAVCILSMIALTGLAWKKLVGLGIKHAALRCAGFNGIDLTAAKELGLAVTRVSRLFASRGG
jgi:D-lactate dehydrogenase